MVNQKPESMKIIQIFSNMMNVGNIMISAAIFTSKLILPDDFNELYAAILNDVIAFHFNSIIFYLT